MHEPETADAYVMSASQISAVSAKLRIRACCSRVLEVRFECFAHDILLRAPPMAERETRRFLRSYAERDPLPAAIPIKRGAPFCDRTFGSAHSPTSRARLFEAAGGKCDIRRCAIGRNAVAPGFSASLAFLWRCAVQTICIRASTGVWGFVRFRKM